MENLNGFKSSKIIKFYEVMIKDIRWSFIALLRFSNLKMVLI